MANQLEQDRKNQLEPALTIAQAIDLIEEGKILLPAIQRRFVWNMEQITMLFDSIMQDFLINTFMFWDVSSDKIKEEHLFYKLLDNYIEYEGGKNTHKPTLGYKNFYAVIDGQQRLNSIYLALKGSYAAKRYAYRKKKYQKDTNDYPPRQLYIDLMSEIKGDDLHKKYDFRFLEVKNVKEYQSSIKIVDDLDGKKQEVECHWFKVGYIYKLKTKESVENYLIQNKLNDNVFAQDTLQKLQEIIFSKTIINYYLEQDQEFDKVLFEFIRTNSGGTKLSFADLLMSFITAGWGKDETEDAVKKDIDELVAFIEELNFTINQDFILKTCLVLLSSDVKFSIDNFNQSNINTIKDNWIEIISSIKNTFILLKQLKFNRHSLRANNAAIPIIYFVFTKKISEEINKDNKHQENKQFIKQYISIVSLNKLFGGSTDGFLKNLRDVSSNTEETFFPLESFKKHFIGKTKSFTISEERLEELLKTEYGNNDTLYILALLFPDFDFDFKNPNIDHLHPKTSFVQKNLDLLENEEDKVFYHEHYNTILNLGLLSEEQNKSKNKSPLNTWLEQQLSPMQIRERLLIPEDASCDFKDFRSFIEKRKELLKERIRNNIN